MDSDLEAKSQQIVCHDGSTSCCGVKGTVGRPRGPERDSQMSQKHPLWVGAGDSRAQEANEA